MKFSVHDIKIYKEIEKQSFYTCACKCIPMDYRKGISNFFKINYSKSEVKYFALKKNKNLAYSN